MQGHIVSEFNKIEQKKLAKQMKLQQSKTQKAHDKSKSPLRKKKNRRVTHQQDIKKAINFSINADNEA